MSGDPLVTHFARQSQRRREAWLLAAMCDLWIWLNAVSALAFRLWVVDRFNYRAILEEKFWPCVFLIEGLVQLSLVVLVWLRLSKLPHNRVWVFTATAAFSILSECDHRSGLDYRHLRRIPARGDFLGFWVLSNHPGDPFRFILRPSHT
jgi:hypothetical protein